MGRGAARKSVKKSEVDGQGGNEVLLDPKISPNALEQDWKSFQHSRASWKLALKWNDKLKLRLDVVAPKSTDCRKLNMKEPLKLTLKLSENVGINGKIKNVIEYWTWVKMVKGKKEADRNHKLEASGMEKESGLPKLSLGTT